MSRKFKMLLVTTAIAVFAAGGALAQDTAEDGADRDRGSEHGRGMQNRGQRGGPGSDRSIRMLTNRLELNETQVQQVRNIYLSVEAESESVREQGRANRTAMRDLNAEDADYESSKQALSAEREEISATARELRERVRSDIDAILTPEQRQKFAVAMERGRERGQRQRRRGDPEPEAR